MNLTLKPISEFLENPPENFVIYGAGNGCTDVLKDLEKICKEQGISRKPRYIIDKNAAEIIKFITPSGETVPVITLPEYAKIRNEEAIVMSIYMDRFGSKVYVKIILDIYETIEEMTIFTDPVIASVSPDTLADLKTKSLVVIYPRWRNGFIECFNDKKNEAAKVEMLIDFGVYGEEARNAVCVEYLDVKTGQIAMNNRLILKASQPRNDGNILFLFGASQINDHIWRLEIKEKFESIANKHGLRLQTETFSAQTVYDNIYMMFGMDLRAGDRVLLIPDPRRIVFDDKTEYAKVLVFINNYLKSKGIELFVYLFPVFDKSGRVTAYESLIPVEEHTRIGYKEFLSYKNYLSANGVRFCVNESINKSDEFVYININHFSNKGADILTDEIINLLENSDFFDENYVETITPDVKRAEFNYLDDLIGKTLVGINEYSEELTAIKKPGKTGAIVINCNPCTNGHMYLIRTAARAVDNLFIFVVEEDKSDFPFEERIALVRENCKDLKNVTVLPSGKFIISTLTFPEYFMKAELLPDEKPSVTLDVTAFAVKIAPALGITERFVGEEPFDAVTREYNRVMSSVLPFYGVEFTEIKRTESGGTAISASRVRQLLEENDFEAIKPLVPEATFNYLCKKYK